MLKPHRQLRTYRAASCTITAHTNALQRFTTPFLQPLEAAGKHDLEEAAGKHDLEEGAGKHSLKEGAGENDLEEGAGKHEFGRTYQKSRFGGRYRKHDLEELPESTVLEERAGKHCLKEGAGKRDLEEGAGKRCWACAAPSVYASTYNTKTVPMETELIFLPGADVPDVYVSASALCCRHALSTQTFRKFYGGR